MVADDWDVYVVNEVLDWINGLDPATHARVVQAIDVLAEVGPALGRPLVDSITGSSIANLKSYGPARYGSCLSLIHGGRASLLVAGDKAGQ